MTTTPPPLPSRERDPYAVLILTSCVAYTALAVPFYDRFGSPSLRAFPTGVALVFLSGLLLFSGITLRGMIQRRPRTEGAGSLALSGIWLGMAIAGFVTSGAKATAFGGFLCAFAVAALCVWWQRLGRGWWHKWKANRS
jgi:prepilin signal peptidase PulO-like enzyme (type II secretory pathway)